MALVAKVDAAVAFASEAKMVALGSSTSPTNLETSMAVAIGVKN